MNKKTLILMATVVASMAVYDLFVRDNVAQIKIN